MITSAAMRRLEELSEKAGASKLMLMERAGKAIAAHVKELGDPHTHTILIFCGSGNNGGDGFVAARHLAMNAAVMILFFGDESTMPGEASANYARIQDDPRITIIDGKHIDEAAIDRLRKKLDGGKLILIDAMLGTGVSGTIRDPIAKGIHLYNILKGKKIAVDIPSGVDPDNGKPAGMMAISDTILTFHDNKPGLSRFHDVIVVDIGIPPGAVRALESELKTGFLKGSGLVPAQPKTDTPWKGLSALKKPAASKSNQPTRSSPKGTSKPKKPTGQKEKASSKKPIKAGAPKRKR